MDLNENIRIAAEVYDHNIKLNDMKVDKIFIDGAKSQAAKDYWYNEFKREQMAMRDKAEWDAKHNTPGGHPFTIIMEEDWFSPEGILSDKPQVDKGKSLMDSIEQIPFEIGGLGQTHHKGVIAIVPDKDTMEYANEITRIIAEDASVQKIIVCTKEHYEAQGKESLIKHISIGMTEVPPIKSIVPINDVMPEVGIDWNGFPES